MANNKISYSERDFVSLRGELLTYVKDQYPDLIQNANDASLFSVFLDLNAAVADNLNYHIDRSLQETVLQYANQRSSLFNIARTYGLKIPGNRPSVSVCDFSITVPVLQASGGGDKEDFRYLGTLRRGSQIRGAGQVFENIYDIDFSVPFDATGFPNRTKIPNFNNSGNIVSYTITKREVVINGITKVFKRVIGNTDVLPFLKIFLPEKNILGVTGVIQKDGTNIQAVPKATEFLTSQNKWYEVDALAQDKVFIVDTTKPSDLPGVKVGKWETVNQRFVTEYTPEGFFFLTLGGGTSSSQATLDDFTNQNFTMDLSRYMNNLSLGITPRANTTLFIQYRVGGGRATNIGPNTLNTFGTIDFIINGPNVNVNRSVSTSLSVNNVTAAIGGANQPTVEEIRNYIGFNFSAQKRAVTLSDYKVLIETMPAVFGAPAKCGVMEVENKIMIKLLSFNPDGSLTSNVSTTLMNNISEYLSDYRMLNDYIVVQPAEIIDLALEIDLLIDPSFNSGVIITNVINITNQFFAPANREMGTDIFVGQLVKDLASQDGVINLIDLRMFNRVGGEYSSNEVSQSYSDPATKQIQLIDGVIFAQPTQSYQVRYPTKDIVVRVKTTSQTTIS
jgi:hypothetical protein